MGIKTLLKFVVNYITRREKALLLLVREEAEEYLKSFYNIGVEDIEDLENLMFHIDNYMEIPEVVKKTTFHDLRPLRYKFRKNGDVEIRVKGPKPTVEEIENYVNYVCEVEKQRAVERDFICESLKKLPLGFRF